MYIVRNINDLKRLSLDSNFECIMVLNYGIFSRKLISYDPSETDGYLWYIFNYIDDSINKYVSDEEFKTYYPLIFEAIETNNLIYDKENCY